MYYFYIVVFLIGVFYTIVSLIITGVSGIFHGGGDIGSGVDGHMGQHGDMHMGDAETGHIHTEAGHINGGHHDTGHPGASENAGGSQSILSWFAVLINPLVAVSFLTVFGGLGIMGIKFFMWSSVVVFVVALISAVAVAAIFYNFVVIPIYRSENTSNVSREQLIGMRAEVTTDILERGFGTIQYTVNSIRCTGPARHIEDRSVRQGQTVFICKIENNTFYVSE